MISNYNKTSPYVNHREHEVDHDTFASLLSLIVNHVLTMQFDAH